MPEFHFEPSARLQRFLGRELIADPNLAVAELVKNGYDAGALQVLVGFGTNRKSKDDQIIVVADNGTGMSREVFNENWMRPGFSYKAENRTPPPAAPGPAATIRARRVPVGEKGLGRLAAARLGDCLEVFTRESEASPWRESPWRRMLGQSLLAEGVDAETRAHAGTHWPTVATAYLDQRHIDPAEVARIDELLRREVG